MKSRTFGAKPIETVLARQAPPMSKTMMDVKHDFLSCVQGHNHSVSRLSLSVNDSAGNKTFEECYDQQDILGEGGFAIVYRCQHRERGIHYAVKEIFNEDYRKSGENLREEVDALKRLREVPLITPLLDVFYERDRTYMIMEEMKGGDLLGRLCEKEVYSENDARKVSRKLLEAIYYCHKKHIVHRDVKPENILLASPDNDTDIKLADFGCAKRLIGPNCLFTLCGSPQYVAPEIYTHETGYDERCDLWSAAVVIYVLLGGYAPFDAPEGDLPRTICEGWVEFHRKYWSEISDPPKDLIRSLLVVDPDERASLEDALDSPWLRRRDKESISGLSLDGSTCTFDNWVKRQNESSQSFKFNAEIEEETDETERSLSLDDL